ncbi:hypothetical protein P3S67_019477 [Capsicum chacoense]
MQLPMLFVVNVFAMHNSRCWLEIFYVHLYIIYWDGHSTDLPLCPMLLVRFLIVEADASCLTCWPLNRVNISCGLFAPPTRIAVEKYHTFNQPDDHVFL